ncbi:hypothetical protein MSAN_00429500 [Mycena sanguinolenta]|uniref:Uncharacterized protein n=1 Tax=Mycena sanguinolenta TaxID=230812 RepID=A0A8H6ZDD7_9AGAR|nr:hypothetical protein MSAN_00429500 [Mycena sanguinolenta]
MHKGAAKVYRTLFLEMTWIGAIGLSGCLSWTNALNWSIFFVNWKAVLMTCFLSPKTRHGFATDSLRNYTRSVPNTTRNPESNPEQDTDNHPPKPKSPASILDDPEEAARIWEQVRWGISTWMLPTSSRYYEERKRVAWAYVCRAIYTDPALMLLALTYADVSSFLSAPDHDVSTGSKLQQQLKALPIAEIWAAIDDVLRPVDTGGEYVTVLGVRIYKASSGAKFPFHAWGHIFSFRQQCPGCVRLHCRTVDDIIGYSRYALLTGAAPFIHPIHLSRPPVHVDILNLVEILAVCGFLIDFPDTGKRVSVTKRFQADKTTIWEEVKNPPIVCVALSALDPDSNEILNELLRRCFDYKHLTVILRRGKGESVIRSATKIASQFKRKSKSLAGLIDSPWVPTLYLDSLLESWPVRSDSGRQDATSKPGSFGPDCMQFLILDGFTGDEDEKYVLQDLLDLCCGIYEATTVVKLCFAIAKPYIESGELEMDRERPQRPFICNSDYGFAAYRSLWGVFPTWITEEYEPVTFPTIWPIAERMPM